MKEFIRKHNFSLFVLYGFVMIGVLMFLGTKLENKEILSLIFLGLAVLGWYLGIFRFNKIFTKKEKTILVLLFIIFFPIFVFLMILLANEKANKSLIEQIIFLKYVYIGSFIFYITVLIPFAVLPICIVKLKNKCLKRNPKYDFLQAASFVYYKSREDLATKINEKEIMKILWLGYKYKKENKNEFEYLDLVIRDNNSKYLKEDLVEIFRLNAEYKKEMGIKEELKTI